MDILGVALQIFAKTEIKNCIYSLRMKIVAVGLVQRVSTFLKILFIFFFRGGAQIKIYSSRKS